MRNFLLLLAFAVAGCTTTSQPSADERVAVVWNRVDNPHQTCESLSGRKSFFNVLGCSQWHEPTASAPRTCQIYAPAPRNERDVQRFATLGHELMHCFDGNWHDKWGRMNTPAQNAQASTSAASGSSAQ